MIETLNDERLMEQLASGKKMAAGILYDRNYKKVFGYFVRMTKDSDVSRDLTQNVFLKILKYSQSWKPDKVFAYWLFRIARNELVDYYRGTKKFFAVEEDRELVIKDSTDSVKEMEIKESYDILIEAMGQLQPGDRELIELNRFQGFSYKEIAGTISSNENAVKVRTFRAIQKLKEIYSKILIE
ncbi:RNA polymerase sigma factor [Maribellus luteus]|uniref:RNA polymerase sigma factor n=1 Tax=Maribellus luteus TaxID=2305463 RepID=A0A399T5L0_9BACT|nr:RNA polymerase sigma factor [Maribellus luteus]RIJ49471.1 RNA polymerase sigma factor [Maribellus luteus]